MVRKTPVVTDSGGIRPVFLVSAVSPRVELYFQVKGDGINEEEFFELCRMLIADTGRLVFLILGNSQVHRAVILKEYADQSGGTLTRFFLPSYSPDLNPHDWV